MALNIFLNGLHDCHDSHCFIMSLLQRVMQKSKKCIVTPQDTPPDTPQDDHTNYELKKAPMSYNPYYRQQKTSSCNHLSFHYSKSFLAQKKSLSALNCFKCNFIS